MTIIALDAGEACTGIFSPRCEHQKKSWRKMSLLLAPVVGDDITGSRSKQRPFYWQEETRKKRERKERKVPPAASYSHPS